MKVVAYIRTATKEEHLNNYKLNNNGDNSESSRIL